MIELLKVANDKIKHLEEELEKEKQQCLIYKKRCAEAYDVVLRQDKQIRALKNG